MATKNSETVMKSREKVKAERGIYRKEYRATTAEHVKLRDFLLDLRGERK